jgi:hypothetical protein
MKDWQGVENQWKKNRMRDNVRKDTKNGQKKRNKVEDRNPDKWKGGCYTNNIQYFMKQRLLCPFFIISAFCFNIQRCAALIKNQNKLENN